MIARLLVAGGWLCFPLVGGALDVAVKPSRDQAWTLEESRQAIELDEPYEAQLVAAEPLVRDPVEVCWDAQGRCYVADMVDYPLGPGEGKPPMSRIQCLFDDNADGRYDRAITFAGQLDHVQGILPHEDGLIATTRTQILFLRDTDGDGVADERRPLIEGFNPSQSQLQVSSPRWGLDNKVYFNNGLDTREIYPSASPDRKNNLARSNFSWDPKTGEIAPASGFGQFGACFDDWGRHYFSSNRSPVMMAVMPYEAVRRNAHAGITQGWEDIAPSGAESRIYPLQVTHTTADAHAGTHTSACGLGVYRGDLMPELRGEIFVCDPTGQLMVRYHPEPHGASLKAARVGDRKEFFRSKDEWCRPVNVTTGPDGALYVCDMYRRYIDHARFFPEEFLKQNDIRQGENEGRIWRIVPKGAKVRKIEPAPEKPEELVHWLDHPNAWQRETAQRLLVKLPDKISDGQQRMSGKTRFHHEVIPLRTTTGGTDIDSERDPLASLERLKMLQILSSEGSHPADEQKRKAVSLKSRDPWLLKAVLSSSGETSGRVLYAVFENNLAPDVYDPYWAECVRSLTLSSTANAHAEDVKILLSLLDRDRDALLWWKPALLQGLAQGLSRSGGKLGVKSIAELTARPPAAFKPAAAEVAALLDQVEAVLKDQKSSLELRQACLPLAGERKWEEAAPLIESLMENHQPLAIRDGAFALLKKFPVEKTAPLLYEMLPQMGPAARREIVTLLAGGKMVMDFFNRIERGEIAASIVDAETRWRYLHSSNAEQKALAEKLFGKPDADRHAVMARYTKALDARGDATKGKEVFMTVCMACHRFQGQGLDVGPDITDVRAKTSEALLTDILDPNRMVEARWSAYQVGTKDGRTFIGILENETDEGITLKLPGGLRETLQRSEIAELKSLDQSLMPAGLDAVITPAQMADLFAYLSAGGAG